MSCSLFGADERETCNYYAINVRFVDERKQQKQECVTLFSIYLQSTSITGTYSCLSRVALANITIG